MAVGGGNTNGVGIPMRNKAKTGAESTHDGSKTCLAAICHSKSAMRPMGMTLSAALALKGNPSEFGTSSGRPFSSGRTVPSSAWIVEMAFHGSV